MNIRILTITHNRPHYTKLSLPRLCRTLPENAKLVIYDNHSSAETLEILGEVESHPQVEKIVYANGNNQQIGPLNWFWASSRNADLLGKVDDDCLVPENWCRVLERAHQDVPEAGVLGCWRGMAEDYDAELARNKIQAFGPHRVMRNCWVAGTGYLMKKAALQKVGLIRSGKSFTWFCLRVAAKGFVNGWYFPFLFQEHMDDPRSPHTALRSEQDFQRWKPTTAKAFEINSLRDWNAHIQKSMQHLQSCSYDPLDYLEKKSGNRS